MILSACAFARGWSWPYSQVEKLNGGCFKRKKPGNITPALLFHPHMHGRVLSAEICNYEFPLS
jgi:hypothetical protein